MLNSGDAILVSVISMTLWMPTYYETDQQVSVAEVCLEYTLRTYWVRICVPPANVFSSESFNPWRMPVAASPVISFVCLAMFSLWASTSSSLVISLPAEAHLIAWPGLSAAPFKRRTKRLAASLQAGL